MLNAFDFPRYEHLLSRSVLKLIFSFCLLFSSSEQNSVHHSILCLRQGVKRILERRKYIYSSINDSRRCKIELRGKLHSLLFALIRGRSRSVCRLAFVRVLPMNSSRGVLRTRPFNPAAVLCLPGNVLSALINNLPSGFISALPLCQQIVFTPGRVLKTEREPYK